MSPSVSLEMLVSFINKHPDSFPGEESDRVVESAGRRWAGVGSIHGRFIVYLLGEELARQFFQENNLDGRSFGLFA